MNNRKPAARRRPKQHRAQQTVAAILDAVIRILKRDGVQAVTTNRIAQVAGVSVGSVYQYFPDKRAIFLALHDRHVDAIGRVVESALVESEDASLEQLMTRLFEALVNAHTPDPELYALLDNEIPHRSGGVNAWQSRLRSVLRLALRAKSPRRDHLDRMVFLLPVMLDAFAHGVTLQRPSALSLAAAKDEALRAITAYLVIPRQSR